MAEQNVPKKRKSQGRRPYTKGNKLQTRANNEQLQALLTKASVYFGGNMSEFLLQAGLSYRPVKKGDGVKA